MSSSLFQCKDCFSMKVIRLLFLLCLIGCSDSEPTVVYQQADGIDTAAEMPVEKDSTLIEAADLPVHFEKTNYLLHPVGVVQSSSRGRKTYFGSSISKLGSIKVAVYTGGRIQGRLHNIYFQHIDSSTVEPLTERYLVIRLVERIQQPDSVHPVLLYTVIDKDTNNDQELSYSDVKSLYISEVSGNMFTKLTPDLQELLDWKYINVLNRIYYRAIEDENANGKFEITDRVRYFYIDLNEPDFEAKEYFFFSF